MIRRIKPQDFCAYLIFLTLILFSLVDSTFKLYSVNYNKLYLIITIIASLVLLFLLYEIKYLWLSIIFVFIFPKPFYILNYSKEFYKATKGLIASLIENQRITQEYYNHFTQLALLAVPLIAAILIYSVIIKKQTLPTLFLGSVIFSSFYYLGSEKLSKNVYIFITFCFVLYSFNQYVKLREKSGKESAEIKSNYFKRFMCFSLMLVILTSLITKVLPTHFKPASFGWIEKNVINRLENIKGRGDTALSLFSSRVEFGLTQTGFQPDPKRLGGPITTNDSLALRFITDESNKEFHLRGSVKDSYTGEIWMKSDNSTQRFDSRIDSGAFGSDYSLKSVRIFHEGLKTSTVFNILYPESVHNSHKYVFVDSNLEIFNPRAIKKGRDYEVWYREYNITNENKLKLMTSLEIKKAEEMKKYLNLPDLSGRVYKLTEEITREYNSPYEKASAIEAYLKKSYIYSKNTSVLPEGKEFVDYFLFDEKKGYCTYYATAMAVMCRIVDIPSRYVEGFAVYKGNSSEEFVHVFNSDAHSWVELYFENTGWVTFDPTPGHDSPAMLFQSDNNNSNEGDFVDNDNDNETGEQWEKPGNNDNVNEEGNIVETGNQKKLEILMYAFLILTFLVSLFVYYFIRRRARDNDKSIENFVRLLINYGKYANVYVKEGETLREYAERLMIEIGIEKKSEVNNIFEEVLYGGRTLTNQDILYIRELLEMIRQKIINNNGRLRFNVLELWNILLFWKR